MDQQKPSTFQLDRNQTLMVLAMASDSIDCAIKAPLFWVLCHTTPHIKENFVDMACLYVRGIVFMGTLDVDIETNVNSFVDLLIDRFDCHKLDVLRQEWRDYVASMKKSPEGNSEPTESEKAALNKLFGSR